MFDNYTLKARFYPVIILFLPLIVLGILYSFQYETLTHALSSLGIVGALTYLFSQVGRDRGKLKEKNLWNHWGGAPTTQILRIRDTLIDKYTKKRYHTKLLALCPVSPIPTKRLESSNPGAVDEIYQAWVKFLISQTRDSTVYPLVLKENTSYGFRRNLWGLKVPAILLLISLIIANYLYWMNDFGSPNLFLYPLSFKYSQLALILILCFWLFVVNKNWVKVPAFSYAERLLESVNNL